MNARLMIVEDERIVALDLKHSLEYLGYSVVDISSNGEDAIDAATRHRPDLVLMDIHLDGQMDGTVAAQEIHHTLNLPVVFLTAYAEEKTLARAETSAPYGYIIKPFELREVEATVRMALARRRVEVDIEKAEERLRLAMDAATLGVWEWEPKTDSFFSSGHLAAILGHAPQVLRDGRDGFLSRIHEQDRPAIEAALDSGTPINATVRMHLHNGTSGWCDLHARVYPDREGADSRVIGVIRDVTEKRHSEEKLRQASVVFRTTAEGIAIMDADRRIISVNPAFTLLTGYGETEVHGMDPDEFLHARRHSDQFYPRLIESPQGYWLGEISCRRRNGEIFPAWQHICAVRDEDRGITHFVMAFSDISAIRQAEAQINHLAFHDALTGLGNRHMLDRYLEQEVDRCRRSNQRLALLFIDLDGFKLINDTMGHIVGDQLLQTIAQRIRGNLRRSDTAIRLGGDEFVVIAPEIARTEDCALLAEKILRHIRASVELPREQVSISASIGIAVFPDNASDQHELITAADSAMYGAKSRGRNRYAFYSPDMAERTRERLRIEQGLMRALQDGDLRLHYQPVVSLADGRMIGMEALVRWQHPVDGLIPPDRFIPIAEESGLIDPIGEWVLREACRCGVEWLSGHHANLRMAVNVSVRQMASENLVDRIAAILAETGFPPSQLEIEITESTLQTIEYSQGVLYRLRSLGASIAIDDFGTGFSSLGLLKHLPIDRIKIDRSFVRGLPDDLNDLAITRAIVALAQSLDIRITAEGIETIEQHQLLRDLGCQDGQGYLFSKPVQATDITALLTASPAKPH